MDGGRTTSTLKVYVTAITAYHAPLAGQAGAAPPGFDDVLTICALFTCPACQFRGACERLVSSQTLSSTMIQNSTQDRYMEGVIISFIFVLFGIIINSINGVLVFTFIRSSVFYSDPRYILYIHLVINDSLMVFFSVTLSVMSYAWPRVPFPFCVTLLIVAATTYNNTPLTLAGMAVERYIAICKPLHHHQICTVRRTYILISLIWCVSVLPGLIDLIIIVIFRTLSVFNTNTFCSSTSVYNTPYSEELSKVKNSLYLSVVWVILVFTYCQVLIAARRASADKSSAKKAQSTILLHGAQLLLCMLSYITGIIDKIFAQLSLDDLKKVTIPNYFITNLLPRLLTPLIYGVRDKLFYNQMKRLFACKLLIVKVNSTKQ
ncbi:odorant receptor 131-2-like [Carassius auratus]|uniref:Odorant receptor 131-2-like n=1 Tax=Carassius auratus TaxID=7957 RepID=A0A6P6NS40_CARAU|nr:odorant receptor 131-2-like [Carassius auratus]